MCPVRLLCTLDGMHALSAGLVAAGLLRAAEETGLPPTVRHPPPALTCTSFHRLAVVAFNQSCRSFLVCCASAATYVHASAL